jgi:hypothetical protein
MKQLRKRARKFAELVREHYGTTKYPFHKILSKAMKYKQKYQMSDAEFSEFQRMYEQIINGRPLDALPTPTTRIGHVLTQTDFQFEGLNVSDKEMGVLQNILKLYEQSRMSHSQLLFQTLGYSDLELTALGGVFDKNRMNPQTHVHPVLAAMFLPKIKAFEDRMLFSNIGNIIKSKHEKKAFNTVMDYEFYHDLRTDPNDMVCNNEIVYPLTDLYNRYVLQTKLWASVSNLRRGSYYDKENLEFLQHVDSCRNNVYDASDFVYVRDEGTIMQRLLNAFAMRPIVVRTIPLYGVVSGMAASPYDKLASMEKLTRVPMLSLRLPSDVIGSTAPQDLASALTNVHWYNDPEVSTLVPRQQQVILAKGVCVFYINRRHHPLNLRRLIDSTDAQRKQLPYLFTTLPLSLSSFEQMNKTPVQFQKQMTIGTDSFILRSVVCVKNFQVKEEEDLTPTDLIIGTSTLLAGKDGSHFEYAPADVLRIANAGAGDVYNPPVTSIGEDEFTNDATEKGTLFIYQKDEYK